MKKIVVFAIVLFSIASYSQEIIDTNGNYSIDSKHVTSHTVKQTLAANPEALKLYKKGANKEAIGGLFLGLGSVCIVSDLVKGLVSNEKYPGGASYVGVAFIAASIPILKGRTKKMRDAISMYNNGLKAKTSIDDFEMNIISNKNGYGIQFQF